MTFDEIKAELPRLSREQRSELVKSIKALDQFAIGVMFHESANVVARDDETLLLEAIHRVLAGKGVEFTQPPMLRKMHGFQAFRAKVPEVMTFLRQGATSRVKLMALADLGIVLLYENLCAMNVAVSSRTVLAHAHRIPSVLNQAFPGYAQAGILGMIVQQYVVSDRRLNHVRSK